MSLYLYELTTTESATAQLLKELDSAVHDAGGALIEAQVTRGGQRLFAVAEFTADPAVLDESALTPQTVSGPHRVRLVGADVEQLKASRPAAGYLVEWDLPEDLTMDAYLTRKKANAPKYADVPEVSFLRTYVREDLDKCLCLYDAPDEAAVRRARDAVSTPIDRLHRLGGLQP